MLKCFQNFLENLLDTSLHKALSLCSLQKAAILASVNGTLKSPIHKIFLYFFE